MAAIDISFTVLERVRQGRRLMRDQTTGQIFWEPAEVAVSTEVPPVTAPAPSPIKKSVAKRRKIQSEGDK